MASLVRPTLLKQMGVASKRALPSASFPKRPIAANPMLRNAFVRDVMPKTLGMTSFHTSARNQILPPGPQELQGSVNDAAPVPPTSPSHGSYHWTFERLVAVGILPLTVAPFAAGSLNPTLDAIFVATIIVHSHIAFDSCITDYFPQRRVPKTRAFLTWLLRGATVAVGVGMYEFETNDVGLTEALKRIWNA